MKTKVTINYTYAATRTESRKAKFPKQKNYLLTNRGQCTEGKLQRQSMIQHEEKQADKTDVGENAKRYNTF